VEERSLEMTECYGEVNHAFRLLFISPCSDTLHECQMKQIPRRS